MGRLFVRDKARDQIVSGPIRFCLNSCAGVPNYSPRFGFGDSQIDLDDALLHTRSRGTGHVVILKLPQVSVPLRHESIELAAQFLPYAIRRFV